MAQFTAPVSDSSFQSDVLNSATPVLVDFWAEWCGPCRALAPKLEEVGEAFQGKVKILKMNVDENPEMTAKFHIRGIPAMLLYKNGEVVGQLSGNQDVNNIKEFLKSHT